MSILKFKTEKDFNNAGLMVDPATAEAVPVLEGMTREINGRCARLKKMLGEVQVEVVGIGKDLIAIRAFIQERKVPGGFDGWLSQDFEWSRSQAYRFIDVANEFGDCPNLGHYDQSALYLLAAPGTPQGAREDAKQIADSGDFVDYGTATTLIDRYKDESQEKEVDETTPGNNAELDAEATEGVGGSQSDHDSLNDEEDDDADGDDTDANEVEDDAEQQKGSEDRRNAKAQRRRSDQAQGQDVRRNFKAPNLESKVWSPENEIYRLEFKKLLTGSGYCDNNIVINGLTRRQLEVLRKQIDDALAGKSELDHYAPASVNGVRNGQRVKLPICPDPSNNDSYFPPDSGKSPQE